MFQIQQIITFIYCIGKKKLSLCLFLYWVCAFVHGLEPAISYSVTLSIFGNSWPPPPTPLTQTHRADQIKIIIRSIQQKGYGICDQLMYLTFYQRNENVGEPWPDSSIYIYIYMSIIKWCGHVKYLLAYNFRFNLQSTYSQTIPSR